jgi:hypothetical protein
MGMTRDLITAVFLLGCLNFSCTREKSTVGNVSSRDSLVSDILKAEVASLYDAETKVHIPNYLLPGEDTIYIKDELIADKNRGTKDSPAEAIKLNSNHFIIVRDYDRSYCMFAIYRIDKKDSIGICYLPTNTAINLVHPNTDDLKIHFYDIRNRILRKYRLRICEKYDLTEDELDSLNFLVMPEIDRIRRQFNVNFD